MKVEIWFDIMCPFCYIGKRRFEAALAEFAPHEEVQVQWRSFELDPNMKTVPGQSIHELLAERKGISVAQGRQMNNQMAQTAAEVGLEFNFDQTVPANTFNAHRFIHLAAAHGRQDAAKERILYAYFTEGLNVDDPATLTQIATKLELPAAEVAQLFETDIYAQDVRRDEYQARQIGVRGVPFFVFDDKYAVSGAQPKEVFLEVLDKVWEESNPKPTLIADGASCGPEGVCD